MNKIHEFYDEDYIFENERERGETPNHWLHRKMFLEHFRSEINIGEINSMAQIYANMEEMGCIYPPGITKRIKILSKELQLKIRLGNFIKSVKAEILMESQVTKDTQPTPVDKYKYIQFVKSSPTCTSNVSPQPHAKEPHILPRVNNLKRIYGDNACTATSEKEDPVTLTSSNDHTTSASQFKSPNNFNITGASSHAFNARRAGGLQPSPKAKSGQPANGVNKKRVISRITAPDCSDHPAVKRVAPPAAVLPLIPSLVPTARPRQVIPSISTKTDRRNVSLQPCDYPTPCQRRPFDCNGLFELSGLEDPLADVDVGLVAMRVYQENLVGLDEGVGEAGQLRRRFVVESFSFNRVNFRLVESSFEATSGAGGRRGGGRGGGKARGGRKRGGAGEERTVTNYDCRAEIAGQYAYCVRHTGSKVMACKQVTDCLFYSMVKNYPVLMLKQYPDTCLNAEYFKQGEQNSSNFTKKGQKANGGGGGFAVRLMKSFGWSEGSGLGVRGQGRVQPVEGHTADGRRGFGAAETLEAGAIDMDHVRRYLNQYAGDEGNPDDVVLGSEFTVDQRRLVHEHCRTRLPGATSTKSYGAKEKRHLVVSKWTGVSALLHMVVESPDQQTNRYRLLDDDSLQEEFPLLFQ